MEVNGKMVPDVSGEELEQYLIENNLVSENAQDAGVPLNAPCSDEQHAQQAGAVKLKF